MKGLFFPVTIIENRSHLLLYDDFSRKKTRYFLSAYEIESSENDLEKIICQKISSSNFLCNLININREKDFLGKTNEENFMRIISQRINFSNRSMIYSKRNFVCTLNINHKSSVLCNTIDAVNQWISIRDLINGLITCDYKLQNRNLREIFIEIDRWLKTNHQIDSSQKTVTDIKSFKTKARQLIWDLMELKNEVLFPRPCHHRIPNFRHCQYAAENVTHLNCFQQARIIKINPSLAQESLRYLTLFYRKILLTPSPALESVFFYKLDPKNLRRNQLEYAATKPGTIEFGTSLNLSTIKNLHIDIVVVASVAVSPINGVRIGKGKGYGDLEYGILAELGCVSDKTIILTTCHESQLINDLPTEIMEEHDLAVDIIVTPRRCIYTKCLFARPKRVYWEKISSVMLSTIPVLQDLKQNN